MGATAYATNGDNLIGIGPISRSMGGVGLAAPQDPISAVFANPAAMCFGPYCPGSEFNFAGTIFDPSVTARVMSTAFGVDASADSQFQPFIIPAMGISTAINPRLRFGLAAYGVSGLGVDYRDKLDLFPGNGSEGEVYTQLQILKFAPNIAYLITDNFSVGASVHVNFANLDLQNGSSHDYSAGVQLGAIYKIGPISLGASYVTSQKATHENVRNFNADLDGSGVTGDFAGEDFTADDLDLESPQTAGFGVAYAMDDVLLIEGNVRWINWSDAVGYSDFDWDDQWVYAIGAQVKPVEKLSLRAGFNYGKNPVNTHNGFDAATGTMVQGVPTSMFGYEYLRIIGFPAIVESHLSFGVGYEFSEKFMANLGYVHAFENTISETGTNFGGVPNADVTLESDLSEDSFEFGLSWRF
jgi:long-chain fatty acid transport protein